MKNVLLYGAGRQCEILLNNENIICGNIIGIIDGNEEKKGSYIGKYQIDISSNIGNYEFDEIIITTNQAQSIIEYLSKNYENVYNHKIRLFDAINIKINKAEEFIKYVCEKSEERKTIVEYIKKIMVQEAIDTGEFEEYTTVLVCGLLEDKYIVNKVFEENNLNIQVNLYDSETICIKEDSKIVICCEKYREESKEVCKRISNLRQWIILPFFDVDNLVVL